MSSLLPMPRIFSRFYNDSADFRATILEVVRLPTPPLMPCAAVAGASPSTSMTRPHLPTSCICTVLLQIPRSRRSTQHYSPSPATPRSHPRCAASHFTTPHVRTLELRFATPAALSQRLRQFYHRCFVLPMRGVRSLRIYGTCPEFVADVASACPALESLETDDNDACEVLVLQPNLRPFMSRTVDDRSTQVKGPSLAVSHGSKAKNLEWRGNVRAKREMSLRRRVWK